MLSRFAIGLAAVGAASSVHANVVVWSASNGGNGHAYQVVSAPGGISWSDAQADAINRGGMLATITSAEENDFVFSLIDDDLSLWSFDEIGDVGQWLHGPWLGGGDQSFEGIWQWATGESFGYDNWYPGEPNNFQYGFGSDEDYVSFFSFARFSEPEQEGGIIVEPSPFWNDRPNGLAPVPVVSYIVEYETIPAPGALALLGITGVVARRRR